METIQYPWCGYEEIKIYEPKSNLIPYTDIRISQRQIVIDEHSSGSTTAAIRDINWKISGSAVVV